MCIVVSPTDDVPKIELQIYYVCYPATENEFKTTNPGINYLFCKSAQHIKCASLLLNQIAISQRGLFQS